MNFNDMPLIAPLLQATQDAGYEGPTPIQRETIPLVLAGRDVLGCAQTGTGKTAAFALPILQKLTSTPPTEPRKPRALVLTPTRELAIQIQENFQLYGKHLPLRSCVIFGGVSQGGQVAELRRFPQILVATPGRLNDLIGQGFIHLNNIEIFVLDEADRMLDMGFIQDVKRIIALLPQKRQTLLFSATMPAEVEKLAMSILNQPETVKVDPVTSTVDTINQTLYMVDKVNKKFLLADLLKNPEVENALVFTRTKHGADRLVRELEHLGVQAMAIHGDKSQNARQAAMGSFKNGELKVLIATDIAARGIDVVGLSHVFNYDLPNEPEAYIHRIGRTGRAGLGGDAVSFCCIDEMKNLAAIERLIGKHIPRKDSAWPMQVFTETVKEPRPPRPARVKDVDIRGNAMKPRQAHAFGDRRPVGGAQARPSAQAKPSADRPAVRKPAQPSETENSRRAAPARTGSKPFAHSRTGSADMGASAVRRRPSPSSASSTDAGSTTKPSAYSKPASDASPASSGRTGATHRTASGTPMHRSSGSSAPMHRTPVPIHANRFGPTSVPSAAPEPRSEAPREEPEERERAAQTLRKRKFESR